MSFMNGRLRAVAAPVAIVGSLLAAAACGGSSPPPAAHSAHPAAAARFYPESSCHLGSAMCGALMNVGYDLGQQEENPATIYKANPSFPQSAFAGAWLPPGSYSGDLEKLAAAVQPYGNAPGNAAVRQRPWQQGHEGDQRRRRGERRPQPVVRWRDARARPSAAAAG